MLKKDILIVFVKILLDTSVNINYYIYEKENYVIICDKEDKKYSVSSV